MLGDKDGYLALGLALGFMGALALFIWFNGLVGLEYCEPGEHHGACLREWVGALSGWAATAAAAVTIIFLYRQNEEQKKQTDFLLGNAPPTIDAIQHMRYPENVVIRIVNWNRRPIVVHHLEIPAERHRIHLKSCEMFDRERPKEGLVERQLTDGAFHPPIAMHGWKDRSRAPCELRIDIAAKDSCGHSAADDWSGTTVAIDLLIAGEQNDALRLVCPVTVAD